MPKTNSLTIKQERFVNGVVEGRSYRDAAIVAGYSPKTAHNASRDILTHPHVEKELTKRLGEQGISADYVLSELKRDIDESPGLNPVRTRSLELLGKHLGIFEKGSEELQGSSQGASKARREALFRDVLEIANGQLWSGFLARLQDLLKHLPPEKQEEADNLFRSDILTELLFLRINLEGKLHLLGEAYGRKILPNAGL